jgi:hypothetical protein
MRDDTPNARCEATTAKGEPCRAYAVDGSTLCVSHLGPTNAETELTTELADQIVAMLRAGNYVQVAVRAVGLSRSTFNSWMARGRTSDEKDGAYRELRRRVHQAQAEGEARNVAQIAKAAADSWQAAAWMLERMAPERWGRVSVRMRDVALQENPAPVVTEEHDPFREVDELAERRVHRG